MDGENTKDLIKELWNRLVKKLSFSNPLKKVSFANQFSRIDFRHPHISHAGTFVLGVFLTFGVVALDGQFNTSDYRKSGAASVLKTSDELKIINEERKAKEAAATTTATTTQGLVEEADEEGEEIVEGFEPRPETEIVEVSEEVEEIVQSNNDGGGQSQEAVEQALEEAQALLEELAQTETQAAQESVSEDEEAFFVTPNGVKIDVNGNVINENDTTTQTAAATDSSTVLLPEGVFTLPNGDLVYADGTAYSGTVSSGVTYVQQDVVEDYYTSPTGAVFNRQGQLISLPPKEEVELIPPTVVSASDPPELGSTIYIPLEVKTWSSNNDLLDCSINFFGNDIELCELYRVSKFDYDWVGVDTE